jgi:hypothetical protein
MMTTSELTTKILVDSYSFRDVLATMYSDIHMEGNHTPGEERVFCQ